jgi:hypothetical protein
MSQRRYFGLLEGFAKMNENEEPENENRESQSLEIRIALMFAYLMHYFAVVKVSKIGIEADWFGFEGRLESN